MLGDTDKLCLLDILPCSRVIDCGGVSPAAVAPKVPRVSAKHGFLVVSSCQRTTETCSGVSEIGASADTCSLRQLVDAQPDIPVTIVNWG